MPEFPTDYDEVIRALAPYYRDECPLDFFFELYIVDVLELLPADTEVALDNFGARHPTFFAKHGGSWKTYVVQELHLSDTIDVAIWDLWIRNSESLRAQGDDYHPWHYAQDFRENYSSEGSQIDVWKGDTLSGARRRIRDYRNRG